MKRLDSWKIAFVLWIHYLPLWACFNSLSVFNKKNLVSSWFARNWGIAGNVKKLNSYDKWITTPNSTYQNIIHFSSCWWATKCCCQIGNDVWNHEVFSPNVYVKHIICPTHYDWEFCNQSVPHFLAGFLFLFLMHFCFLMCLLRASTWIRVSIWLSIGVLVYTFYGRTHSSLRDAVYVPAAHVEEIYRSSENSLP